MVISQEGLPVEWIVIWGSDASELNMTDDVNLTLTESNSFTYMSTYTIEQLSTSDKDRIYYCELVINSHPPVEVNDSILLNVTSKLRYMFYNHVIIIKLL